MINNQFKKHMLTMAAVFSMMAAATASDIDASAPDIACDDSGLSSHQTIVIPIDMIHNDIKQGWPQLY